MGSKKNEESMTETFNVQDNNTLGMNCRLADDREDNFIFWDLSSLKCKAQRDFEAVEQKPQFCRRKKPSAFQWRESHEDHSGDLLSEE